MDRIMGLIQDPRFSLKNAKQPDTPPSLSAAASDKNPTTPHPAVNADWTKKKKRPTFKKDLYGIDLCMCALNHFMRINKGQVPDGLWVSDLLLPEIRADMLMLYQTTYNGYIPFLHGKKIIKGIRIRIDDSLPKDTVAYSLP